jgi:hypothetical protein
MPVGIAQAVGRQGIYVRRVDAAAVTAKVAVADVVKHDHQHIRLARSGARRQVPMWLRILQREADFAPKHFALHSHLAP